ncbi:hypothetical protein FOPE_07596 [Fonsecaea pedrosoi]|nr:hypothetical protein FOPE_07596 [Fonsecaea pedrosoi]
MPVSSAGHGGEIIWGRHLDPKLVRQALCITVARTGTQKSTFTTLILNLSTQHDAPNLTSFGSTQYALMAMLSGKVSHSSRAGLVTCGYLTTAVLTHVKVVLITGCSSGIGLATTKACLDAKAQVFGCDVQKPPAELSGLLGFSFQTCDVSKQADISATVEACAKAFNGRIDVLLNVAGISDRLGSVDSLDDEEYDRVVAVDLTGPIKLMRAVIPYMRAQKSGSIVNISSRAGLGGGVAGVTYTASKHGLASGPPSSLPLSDERHKMPNTKGKT